MRITKLLLEFEHAVTCHNGFRYYIIILLKKSCVDQGFFIIFVVFNYID